MRRIRVRAVRVTCIASAFALVPAAALAASADYFLKIEGVDGESKDDKHKGQIETSSYSWGATQTGSAHVGGGLGSGKANMQDISVMGGPRQTTAMDGTHVAAGDVDGDGRADVASSGVKSPRDAATGQASGRRTHPPLIKITKPLERGSISLAMKLPGCAVGNRYPSAELATPTERYTLHDLVVTSCDGGGGGGGGGAGSSASMEQVSFNYAKVKVRAWDPAKKEE